MAPPTLLVVDGTNLVMRAALGGSRPPDAAARTAVGMIARQADAFGATHLVVAFDHPAPSWRRERAADYKAGRSVDTAPFGLALLDAVEGAGWHPAYAARYEADDVLATLAARGARAGAAVYLYTGDSDGLACADGVPGAPGAVAVLKPLNGGAAAVVSAADVCAEYGLAVPARLADFKALAGEPGDNVAGLGGRTAAGAVSRQDAKARQLLARYGSLDAVLAAAGPRLPASVDERGDLPDPPPPAMLKLLELAHARREALLEARALLTLSADVPLAPLDRARCAYRPLGTPASAPA